MKRLIRWLASEQLHAERTAAYLRGYQEGRAAAPMTCGLTAAEHCGHSYLYDPGQ